MADLNAADLAHLPGVPPAPTTRRTTPCSPWSGDATAWPRCSRWRSGTSGRPGPVLDIPAAPERPHRRPHRGGAQTVTAEGAGRLGSTSSHRTHPFGSPGYDVATVAATVLGSGRGSRLYQRLADGERLAQPDLVGAYGVDLAHAPAPVIATATARPGVKRRTARRRGRRGGRRTRHRAGHRRRAGPGQGAAQHRLVAADGHGGRPGRRARPGTPPSSATRRRPP